MSSFLSNSSKRNFLISLHLFNITLLDEFIHRINQFVQKNTNVQHNILFTIPICSNIDNLIYKTNISVSNDIQMNQNEYRSTYQIIQYIMENNPNQSNPNYEKFFFHLKKKILQNSFWLNPNLIHHKNSIYLVSLMYYIKTHIKIDWDHVHFRFIPNRGVDIGGFMSMLKFVKSMNHIQQYYDYYIIMHTKTITDWRRKMLKMLDIPTDYYIDRFDCIYTKDYNYIFDFQRQINEKFRKGLFKLMRRFELPPANFHYSAGTFFIVNNKFIQLFSHSNIDLLFAELNPYKSADGSIEYCYERFFGYLMDYHRMKKLLV
jgi:hypothetical protein